MYLYSPVADLLEHDGNHLNVTSVPKECTDWSNIYLDKHQNILKYELYLDIKIKIFELLTC